MAESSLESLVKSIRDGQEGIVTLQNTDGSKQNFDCVYKESIAPNFFVVFKAGDFAESMDITAPITFSVLDGAKESSIITAKFTEKVNNRTIELTAAKSIDPTSLREYFRVDIRTDIKLSFSAAPNIKHSQGGIIYGKTLDLSATGVLAIFPKECKKISNINIEIKLDHPASTAQCIGHVVRTRKTRRGSWVVALHFDQIKSEIRDDIITNCLWEQRRQLRENIQTSE